MKNFGEFILIDETDSEDKLPLKNKSGVYAVYLDYFCLYVGATKNLRGRITRFFTQHAPDNVLLNIVIKGYKLFYRDLKINIRVYFFPVWRLRAQEQKIMKKLNPTFNYSNKFYDPDKRARIV